MQLVLMAYEIRTIRVIKQGRFGMIELSIEVMQMPERIEIKKKTSVTRRFFSLSQNKLLSSFEL